MDAYRVGYNDARAGMERLPDLLYTLAQVVEYEQGFHDGWWEAD